MFIKYLDYLSPKVTFYHKGFLSHSSILSGILSIISILFVIILAVYFILDVIKKTDPKTFYLHTFLEDAGIYQLNSSTLFHFVHLIRNFNGATIYEGIDFTAVSIIGSQLYGNNHLKSAQYDGLESFDHWIYGYCNKEINTKGLDDLITYEFFNKSACVKKYYNSTDHEYYDIGHPKFSWPIIAHGTFNAHNKLYGIYIQKCNNKTIKHALGDDYQCKNDLEIDNYFDVKGTRLFHLYFINNYVNISNYAKPYINYFYRIENQLNSKQYSLSEMNINPTVVKTNDGLIFDNMKENISYTFDRDSVYLFDKGKNDIYACFCILLKNIRENYGRSYKRIQDAISNIGGINQAITLIAIYINSLYNHFVVLLDTELLLHSSIYNEKENNKDESIKNKHLKNKIKDKEKSKHENKNILKREKINNKSPNSKIRINKSEIDISKTNKFINNSEQMNYKMKFNFNKIIDNKGNSKNDNKKKNFLDFLYYKITCGKKAKFFKIYEDFRMKIISEEHIIRNHLNIYNLLKITEKKRYKRRSSYQLKDLINLI